MTGEMIKQIENDYWEEKADPIDIAKVFDLAQKALEQEPKKGHWIMLGNREEIYCEEAKCSICGSVEVNAGYDKYCPNCGAKMVAESEVDNANSN